MDELEQIAFRLYRKFVWRNPRWHSFDDMSDWAKGYWLGQAELQKSKPKR